MGRDTSYGDSNKMTRNSTSGHELKEGYIVRYDRSSSSPLYMELVDPITWSMLLLLATVFSERSNSTSGMIRTNVQYFVMSMPSKPKSRGVADATLASMEVRLLL